MKIFSSAGVEILDIQVDDSSVRYRSIMSGDSLTLQFSTTGPVMVPRNSYVDFEGARYTLFYPENFKKNSTRDFAYTLTLHGWSEALKLYKYKDLSAKPYRLKFLLTARPIDFLQLLVDNMSLHDPGWSLGDCIEADEKLISFNHEYCSDVLSRLAQEFNTEWEITGKTIHLRKVEKFKDDPLALSYGMGNGFETGVGRQNDGDRQPIGRLYVQGGERNIDYSEYGSSSLLLPKSATLVYEGKTYKTDADGMYVTRDGNTNTAEDSYDGSNHYPKRVGAVSHVIAVDADKHFYDIRDTSIPAALNYRDCRIPGEKATIVFQSGALAGREFDIEQTDTDLTGYIHAERRFKIVPAELDGQIMPGGIFVPQVGDKYAIFNIRMPDAYISDNVTQSGASWDMFREAVKYFAEEENDKFSFTGKLDGVWSKTRWLEIGGKIVPGGHVQFSDPQFQPDGILIRITAVKDYINKPHKPEITLSNAPVSGSFSADLGKIEAGEVVREADKKEVIRFTKRQYRDAKETMSMLQQALLNFSGSINPITVQTMQLLVGDESLQFRFVNSKTNPQLVTHNVSFNASTKVMTASSGILQHMTLGITSLKKSHAASEYKYWDMAAYISPALDANKAYYLYAKCSKTNSSGTFLLSETPIAMEAVTGYYHFLLGVLNSEQDGDRSFAPLYGFTEILPGRITTDMIVSQDGKTYFDLLSGIIGGKIRFLSSGSETDLEMWAGSIQNRMDNLKAGINLSTLANWEQGMVDFNASARTDYVDTQLPSNKHIRFTTEVAIDPEEGAWVSVNNKGYEFAIMMTHDGQYHGTHYPFSSDNLFLQGVQDDAIVIILRKKDGSEIIPTHASDAKLMLTQGSLYVEYSPATEDVQGWINNASAAAAAAQSYAEAVNDSVGDLDVYINNAFKDGVVEEAEAKAIEKYINQINKEKSELEATYNKLYVNPLLSGAPKTNLLNAKITLFGDIDNLISIINSVIDDGRTTPAEKTQVDNAFSVYKNSVAVFRTRIEEARQSTEQEIKSAADGAQNTAADALAKANISKAITDKFGTTASGGLISTVITEFREADSTQVTGLISGIQGANKDLPFLVAGGTYEQGIGGTAKAIIWHDGKAKFTNAEITGKITATSGELGTLTMQAGGYIDLPPTFTSRKGRLDNAGLNLIYDGANSQKIEWYSGMGVFAGRITCNSSGRLSLLSDFGVELGVDAAYNKIAITLENFWNSVDFGGGSLKNIRELRDLALLRYSYTTHSLFANTNYAIQNDTTLIVFTSVGANAGVYKISGAGGATPSNGEIRILLNTSTENNVVLKANVTGSNIRVALNGGPWFRMQKGTVVVLVYYGGYWHIHTDWGQEG